MTPLVDASFCEVVESKMEQNFARFIQIYANDHFTHSKQTENLSTWKSLVNETK